MQQQKPRARLNWTEDETVLALDLYFRLNGPNLSGNLKTNPQVTELSSLLQRLPIYDLNKRSSTFRNGNAVEMKLQNLRSLDPSYSGKGLKHDNPVEQAIWDKYANNQGALRSITQAIRDNFQGPEDFIPELDDDEGYGASEGRVFFAVHRRRERDRGLVRKKKDRVLKKLGKLECEVCGFDFAVRYGSDLGTEIIDCHHKTPLSELKPGNITRLDDLALVCSNCHRVLHSGKTVTIEELGRSLR